MQERAEKRITGRASWWRPTPAALSTVISLSELSLPTAIRMAKRVTTGIRIMSMIGSRYKASRSMSRKPTPRFMAHSVITIILWMKKIMVSIASTTVNTPVISASMYLDMVRMTLKTYLPSFILSHSRRSPGVNRALKNRLGLRKH